MMDQIKYKSGTFHDFIATRSFALGTFDVRIAKGSELAFDGSRVNYAGDEYVFPQLRSAVTAGWIVLSRDYDEESPAYNAPISANIQVHSAVGAHEQKTLVSLTEPDERIVMSSATHAQSTRDQNKAARNGQGQQGQARTASIADSQDGIPVRSLKTPSKSKSSLAGDQYGAALAQAENVQITPGQGITVDEMLERMSPEERDAYLATKAAKARPVLDDADSRSQARTLVGKVKKSSNTRGSAEGMTAHLAVGGGVETADMGGSGGSVATEVVEEDGIKFTTTNGPKHRRAKVGSPVQAHPVSDMRVKIALAISASFPVDYDFSAPLASKLELLRKVAKKHGQAVLLAAYAAESDEVKAALEREFPQAFA